MDEINDHDPWRVADDIEDMIEGWDPDQVEMPAVDDDWVNRRLLALRFTLDEAARTQAQYERQIKVLQREIDTLQSRLEDEITATRATAATLTGQLQRFHQSRIADAVRRGVKRLPTMIRMPHGDLRSHGGGNVIVDIEPGQEQEVVDWLVANGMTEAVRHIDPVPARDVIDKRRLPGLVQRSETGAILGVVSPDGEPMPHATYRERPRAHWVELPDGRSSKDWMQD